MILPVLQSLLTLALLVATFGFLFVRLRRIVTLINTGSRGDEVLTGDPGERLGKVVSLVLGHKRVLADPWAGVLHLFFLYGFLTLGIGHLEIVLEGLTAFLRGVRSPGRSPTRSSCRPGLDRGVPPEPGPARRRGPAGGHDRAGRGAGRVTRGGCSRARRTPRTSCGSSSRSTSRSSCSTGSSVLLRQRARGRGRVRRATSRSASLVAAVLGGVPDGALGLLRGASWWAHVLVFLGFAAYIPMTKHMHLVFAAPNIYFFRKKRYGLPPAIDFEKTEKFGVDRVQELPWKTLLDTFACTECDRCNEACPAHATGKPLKPMKVVRDVKMNLLYRNGADILRFRDAKGRADRGEGGGGGGVRARRRR